MAIFGNWVLSLGSSPMGQFTPFTNVGLIFAGVAEVTFRSNVSTVLIAPVSSIKMQFFAVFLVATPWDVISGAAGAVWVRYEPVSPAPVIRKKSLRVQ